MLGLTRRSALVLPLLVLSYSATPGFAQASSDAGARAPGLRGEGAPPPRFVANVGQWDAPARFRIGHGAVNGWILDDGFVVDLQREHGCALGFVFEGAAEVTPVGVDARSEVRNYLRGGARHAQVPTYAAVRFSELQPGVDLVLREGTGLFQYDLELAPGAALETVTVRVEGARSLRVEADGRLVIETALGVLHQTAPVAWTVAADGSESPLACSFRLLDEQRFGFAAPGRGEHEALVVDPGIEWGSYLGDYEDDVALDITVAPNGEAIVVGLTASPYFPVTRDAYDLFLGGNSDAFVARFTADGKNLVFATYLGGGDAEIAYGVALGAGDQIVVTGETRSADFPVTAGAYDTSHNGGADVFVSILSGDGEQLLFSTFLGGSGDERAYDLVYDPVAGATICGLTFSAQFPMTLGAYDATYSGNGDAFVARLSPDLASLQRSTFLGDTGGDVALALGVAANGDAVVAGLTSSFFFPTTPFAFDRTPGGTGNFQDGFVTRFNANLTGLVYSSFLGGVANDAVRGLALRADGAVVLVGETLSGDFPTTAGAIGTSHFGAEDAFVTVLEPGGSYLLYSSFLGGTDLDRANDVAFAPDGSMLITGLTRSPDFPVTPWGVDSTFNNTAGSFLGDVFVVKLSAEGALEYGTFIGGNADEEGTAITAMPDGRALVCGRTTSVNFPTPGGFDTTYDFSGQPDGFVVCLEFSRFPFDYGDPGPSSTGYTPVVGSSFASLAHGSHQIYIDLTPPNTTGWLFHGQAAAEIPFGSGTLLVAPPLVRHTAVPLDFFGATTVTVPIVPAMVGTRRHWQFWFVDTASASGFGFSPGLEVTYYP